MGSAIVLGHSGQAEQSRLCVAPLKLVGACLGVEAFAFKALSTEAWHDTRDGIVESGSGSIAFLSSGYRTGWPG
jgi:hypothetical protein